MAKTKPARSQKQRNKRQAGRCWPGYEPTPGKKPGAKGSCKPKSSGSSGRSTSRTSRSTKRRTSRTTRQSRSTR